MYIPIAPCRRAWVWSLLLLAGVVRAVEPGVLSLAEAERLALADEPGTRALELQARAARDRSVADAQLPDPMLSVGAVNVPVDTFDFDAERMTQLRVGLKQNFPGGDERDHRSGLQRAEAERLDARAALRRRDLLRAVRLAFLDLGWLEEERRLLTAARPLLDELEQTALSAYREGAGAQQDVLRARLEREAFGDRLLRNEEATDLARAELARWIGGAAYQGAIGSGPALLTASGGRLSVDDAELDDAEGRLAIHPLLHAHDAHIRQQDSRVGLAEAAYRPDWGLEVAWGARDDLSPLGDTPDLLSAVVSVELPLFTARRQDRRLAAAQGERESARAARVDALRDLRRQLERERATLIRLRERMALYSESILPMAEQNLEAARRGYRADTTDFPEVVRSELALLDADIERHRIGFEIARSWPRLRWLIGEGAEERGHE